MKKYYLISQIFLIVITILIFHTFSGFKNAEIQTAPVQIQNGIKPLAAKINSIKNSGRLFVNEEIFRVNNNFDISSSLNQYVKRFVCLKLDENKRNDLLSRKDANITFRIPIQNGYKELELTKSDILTQDFKAGALTGNGTVQYVNYEPGLYYRGIIKGDNESFASLSIFNDFVMAVASNSEGNWNLASIKDDNKMYTDNYVFYNDNDLINKKEFKCDVGDDNNFFDKRYKNRNNGNGNMSDPPQLVRKYFECDFRMYQDFGSSVTNVNNYVTSFFNSCAAMYAQDSINTAIQQIYVWTTPDIYSSLTDNARILTRFGGRLQNSINGDLAHWLSTRTDISGGVAWVGVLCTPFEPSDSSGRYAVSVIDNQYVPFPQYSWVVNVVVHEMGHNLGSNHTHNCSWPGGPIDSCYQVEGGCYSGPLIPRVGTVMSYCHLNSSVNLALGFGHYPGDTIRANIRRASCLTIGIEPISTEIPKSFNLFQNYPNPFNPSTKIKFALTKGSLAKLVIYDIVGKEVEIILNEQLGYGTYQVEWPKVGDAIKYPSGVYFYKLSAGDFVETRKMMLIK